MLKQLTQHRAEQPSNHPSHTIRILYDERQLRNTCMAAHLPTLCTAPSSSFFLSSNRSSRRMENLTLARARRRNPARSVKATTLLVETAGDCGTKLSAWKAT
jgi:hypothetical protein